MATYRVNLKSIDVPPHKQEWFKMTFSRALGELTSFGCVLHADGEIFEQEGLIKAEPLKEENESLICSECGFVAQHKAALLGHIRFKHKRT